MQFRAKASLSNSLLNLCLILFSSANAILWLYTTFEMHGRRAHFFGRYAILFLLVALFSFVGDQFVVWEIDEESLRQLSFGFKTKEFQCVNIVRVGLVNYEQPESSGLVIEYLPPGAHPTCWRPLKINPVKREEFISALQRFAKKATFDLDAKV
jgi:hypothetical protein